MHSIFSYIKRIINIMIIIESISLTESSQYFKSYQLISGDLLIINSSEILLQNEITKELSIIKSFDNSLDIQWYSGLLQIEISQFSSNKDGHILCYVNSNLYIISNDYQKICTISLELSTIDITLIPYDIKIEEGNKNYYYIICFLSSNNNINIHEYYYNIDNCNNTLKNSNSVKALNSLKEESLIDTIGGRFHCELMYNEIVTCFAKNNYPIEISNTSFDLKKNLSKISEYCGTINLNSHIISIRSVLSEDKKKALMCFINGDGYVYCNIYDIINNKWGENVKMFNTDISKNNDALKVKYIKETKEFIILGAVEGANIELMKLDENYNVKCNNDKYDYCYSEQSIKENDCYYFYSYDIYYSNIFNNYYATVGCKEDSFVNRTISEEYNIKLDGNTVFYNESISSENNIKEEEIEENEEIQEINKEINEEEKINKELIKEEIVNKEEETEEEKINEKEINGEGINNEEINEKEINEKKYCEDGYFPFYYKNKYNYY